MASNDGDRQSTVWTGLGVLILVVFVGLIGFAIQGTDFFLYRFFAPKHEEARRKKFWPTVITTDCKGSRRNTARGEHWTCNPGESLTDAVWLNDPADYNRPLNPDWTEMLMGFPKEWTVP